MGRSDKFSRRSVSPVAAAAPDTAIPVFVPVCVLKVVRHQKLATNQMGIRFDAASLLNASNGRRGFVIVIAREREEETRLSPSGGVSAKLAESGWTANESGKVLKRFIILQAPIDSG